MKQPKFRGFCLETKQWHYGHGWFKSDYTEEYKQEKGIEDTAILYTDSYPVECELASMGQFIRLVDIHYKEIFEGHVVQYVDDSHVKRTGTIVFKNGSFAIQGDFITSYRLTDYSIEIIGDSYKH